MLKAQILGGPSGGKCYYHHSERKYSTPRLGRSGGMLLQEIFFNFTPSEIPVASETILHQSLMVTPCDHFRS